MNFNRTAEQIELSELARKVFASVDDKRLRASEQAGWFDEALWAALSQAGLLSVAIGEESGGAGYGFVEACLLFEQAGRGMGRVPVVETVIAALAIDRFGDPGLKSRLLPGVVDGSVVLSAGFAEADGGDPRRPGAWAEMDGVGYRLTGDKIGVAQAGRAERVLVAARVGHKAGLFLVDPRGQGVTLAGQITTTGEPVSTLSLAGARIAAEDVLAIDDGAAVDWVVARFTVALCAMELGIARRQLELTSEYAMKRQQFGKPIGLFQAVAQRAADAYIDVECIALSTWQAAFRLGRGEDAAREVAVAKFWASEAGARVASAAQHIHAGMGFDKGYPLYRYYLAAKQIELALGGAGAQLARLGGMLADG